MKRLHIDRAALHQAASSPKKRPAPWLFALCILVVLAVVVSMMLLGSSLGRFSTSDAHAIPLVPDTAEADVAGSGSAETDSTRSGIAKTSDPALNGMSTTSSAEGSATTRSAQGQATKQDASASNAADSPSAGNDASGPARSASSSAVTKASDGSAGSDALQVSDAGTGQAWSSETQIDLFKESYDGTVGSAEGVDGDKLIAPGTTNRYEFMLRNNIDVPLDYEVALQVEAWSAALSADGAGESVDGPAASSASGPSSTIPLEWRLLDADDDPVSDWQMHGSSADVLDSATLAGGRQVGYTIEWRWAFEQGALGAADAADMADTAQGDRAALEDFGVKATIFVHAEQDVDPDDPPANDPTDDSKDPAGSEDPDNSGVSGASQSSDTPKTLWETVTGWLPRTGDSVVAMLVAGLVAVAALAVIVIVVRRGRKEDDDSAQR